MEGSKYKKGWGMELSQEELAFFSNMFADKSTPEQTEESGHALSIKSEIPSNLYQVFEQSKLTLLAEVSHYQLWFPLEMTIENGEFKPVLGTPEIVDIQNGERSWRGGDFVNVELQDQKGKAHDLLSLSSTGIAFRVSDRRSLKRILNEKSLCISLPNEEQVALEFEAVRVERDVVAAKIAKVQRGRDRLRKFLFNLHRNENQQLYQGLQS